MIGNVADSPIEGGGGISYAGDKAVAVGETAAIEDSRIRDNKSHGPGGGIDSRGDGPLRSPPPRSPATRAATGGGDPPRRRRAARRDAAARCRGTSPRTAAASSSTATARRVVENSTVSGNRAGMFGGGLLGSSRLTVRSSTVAAQLRRVRRRASTTAAAISSATARSFLANTIVAGSPTGGNCAGTITSHGGNVDSGDSCQFRELSDQPGTDPRLGPLAANGGPTQTHALLAASPAQERAVCTDVDPCPPVDQRGVERPLFVGVDAGAYESELLAGGRRRPAVQRADRAAGAGRLRQLDLPERAGHQLRHRRDAEGRVEAGANDRALVHFALPPVPPGCRLVGATLRLYSSAGDRGPHARGAAPRVGVERAGRDVGQPAGDDGAGRDEPVRASAPREWDVLAQTRDMYARGNHGFLVRDAVENELRRAALPQPREGRRPPARARAGLRRSRTPAAAGRRARRRRRASAADRDSWISAEQPLQQLRQRLHAEGQVAGRAPTPGRWSASRCPACRAGCTGVASARPAARGRLGEGGADDPGAADRRTLERDRRDLGNRPATAGAAAATASVDGPLEWA